MKSILNLLLVVCQIVKENFDLGYTMATQSCLACLQLSQFK